jgi:hypothetical protein
MAVGVLAWAEADKISKHDRRGDRRISSRPELEYLKAVNSAAPPEDPQLLFLLMGEFANANQQAEGAEFLSARLNEFSPRLSDAQKALYLSAIGLLRAQNASSSPYSAASATSKTRSQCWTRLRSSRAARSLL